MEEKKHLTDEHKKNLSNSMKIAYLEGRKIKAINSGCFQLGHKRTPEEESYRISTLPKGENAIAWKGGVSRPYCYKVWRESGRSTDKCESCNNLTNGKYVIHHKDGDYTNNKIENLECDCYKCHNNSKHHMGKKTQFKPGHSVSQEWKDKWSSKLKGRKQPPEIIAKRIETMRLKRLIKDNNEKTN